MDQYMRAAIEEARKGMSEGGIPIGSVLVRNGEIVGRGNNRRVQEGNPMKHAEIDCLINAGRVGKYRDTIALFYPDALLPLCRSCRAV